MSTQTHPSDPGSRKKHFHKLAFWHLLNLIAIFSILITVLLVKTIFSAKSKVPIIHDLLEKQGRVVSQEIAKNIAKLYSSQLWDWHLYFGFALTVTLLLRLFLELRMPKQERLFGFIRTLRRNTRLAEYHRITELNYLFVRIIYIVFYTDLLFMCLSGLFIWYSDSIRELKSIRHTVKEMHNVGMYVLIGFICLHLSGLVIRYLKDRSEER
jgi:cytochrome b561